MSKNQKEEKIKSVRRQNLSLRDGCYSSACRLALLSSLILAKSRILPPSFISKEDFDEEFLCLLKEQVDSLSDCLFAMGAGDFKDN